jgi:hypothetical protein
VRGRSTWLLLAALIGLGVVAALDALRGGDGEPERVGAQPTTSPAAKLRRAAVTGVLYVSVRSEDGCRLRALSFPSLQDAASFELEWCRFDVSPQGRVVSGSPCRGRGGDVDVFGTPEEPPATFPGCAPAWKPNGALTFVRDGDVLTAEGSVLVDDVPFLVRSSFPYETRRIYVREIAWLTDTRLVAVVHGTGIDPDLRDLVVLVEDGRRLSGGELNASRIHVSQQAQQIFVAYPGSGLVVYDRRGVVLSPESRFPFPDVAAAVDSPDGRWIALARPGNVCIYEPIEPRPREEFPVTCLPFDAVDLAWLQSAPAT